MDEVAQPDYHPVLVGYDGPDSEHAVQLASRMGSAIGQPLVLTASHRRRRQPAADVLGSAVAQDDPVLLTAGPPARQEVSVTDRPFMVGARVLSARDAAAALLADARAEDVCAVVLGRDRQGAELRELLEHAACPVLISSSDLPAPATEALRTIGVAFDGSVGAESALTAAMRIAGMSGAHVRLIAVGALAEDAAVEVAAAATRLHGSILDVLLCSGRPGSELVEASRSLDLLVCGSWGRGTFRTAPLGRVSGELVRSACCPVLVVGAGVGRCASAPFGLTTAA